MYILFVLNNLMSASSCSIQASIDLFLHSSLLCALCCHCLCAQCVLYYVCAQEHVILNAEPRLCNAALLSTCVGAYDSL